MNLNDWKSTILAQQGLTQPRSVEAICQRLNGLQAQFSGYVLDGFRSRMEANDFATGNWQEKLVRQWIIRSTVHAYLKEDIPLYQHVGSPNSDLRLDMPSRNGLVSAERKRYFYDMILDYLADGGKTREEIKAHCLAHGMTEEEKESLLHAWGGLLLNMCAAGKLYQHFGERRFSRLENFVPMEQEAAEWEIARRYFSGFGPVSLADARYYFKYHLAKIKKWMQALDLQTVEVDGETRYYLGELPPGEIPKVLFVAGFDQLLLGYEKRQNPFFDPKYIRDLYTMTGIIKPVVLLEGTICATWRKDKGKLWIKPLWELKAREKKMILKAVESFAQEQGLVFGDWE